MAAMAATSATLFNSSKKIVSNSSTTSVADAPITETKDYVLPRWADFDLGRAPVYWKTMNGLSPTAGERLKLFYNPMANKLVPNEDYGIALNGDVLYLGIEMMDLRDNELVLLFLTYANPTRGSKRSLMVLEAPNVLTVALKDFSQVNMES